MTAHMICHKIADFYHIKLESDSEFYIARMHLTIALQYFNATLVNWMVEL